MAGELRWPRGGRNRRAGRRRGVGRRAYDAAFSVPGAAGTLTLEPAGATNLYVGTVQPSGDWAWLKRVGHSSDLSLEVTGFAADDSGAFVVAGTYASPLVLGGPSQELSPPNPQGSDAFLARFYGDGTLDWHQEITGPGDDVIASLHATASGTLVYSRSSKDTLGLSVSLGTGEDVATFTAGGVQLSVISLFGAGTLDWAVSAVAARSRLVPSTSSSWVSRATSRRHGATQKGRP